MSIVNFFKKSKSIAENNHDALVVIIIILTAFGGFGIGRLSTYFNAKENITILQQSISRINNESFNLGGYYIASKNGTKYHFPWCSGAQRIKSTNKITFGSKDEAEKAGYSPASNCKGL